MNKTSIAPEKFSPYQTYTLFLLGSIQFLVMLDFMIIAPISYLLMTDLHINAAQFGLIHSSYIFAAAGSGIVSASFIDRFDRKKILLVFFAGFVFGTLLCGLANSFYTLLAARIFTGIFGGVIGSLILTIITDLFLPSQRGRAMSIVQMSFAASQILGIPLGLYLSSLVNWSFTFYFIVCCSVPVGLLLLLKFKALTAHLKTSTPSSPFKHWWVTVTNKNHLLGFSATMCLGLSMMMQPFVSVFLKYNLQVSDLQIPVIFMITGAAAFFIMPMVGKLSDRFDKFKIFVFASLASLIVLPLYTQLSAAPFWLAGFLNVLLFSLIMSRMGPYQALHSMIPEAASRGAYLSLSSALAQLSGGLGVLIASNIVSQTHPADPLQNFDLLAYVVMTIILVSIFLVYRVNRLVKQSMRSKQSA